MESFSGKRNREMRGRWGQMEGVFLRVPDSWHICVLLGVVYYTDTLMRWERKGRTCSGGNALEQMRGMGWISILLYFLL